MKDDSFPQLSTPRLCLRRFRESDAEAFARYRSDPGVARYQDWEAPYSMEQARRFVSEMADRRPALRRPRTRVESNASLPSGRWLSAGPLGTGPGMTEELSERDIVYESALQLWAAAQTDFDPYQVSPDQWGDAVAVRDVDIATDARLDLDTVRTHLRDLDGRRLVIGDDAGNLSVKAPIPEDGPL